MAGLSPIDQPRRRQLGRQYWPAGRGCSLRPDGPIQLAYHIDGLTMFALYAGIGPPAVMPTMDHEKGTTRFYSLILIFIGGLIHLVYTADLFILFNGEKLGSAVPSGRLAQPAGSGVWRTQSLHHYTPAGYGLLAMVRFCSIARDRLFDGSESPGSLTTGIFLLMITRPSPNRCNSVEHLIPFAMYAPTPVSALLHAACYVKAGVI